MLKTCLYDNGVLNIKDLMRSNNNDSALLDALLAALGKRAKDGWEAESKTTVHESMASIGG
jgi:cyclic pyranopterin phosphate synthase